MQPFHNSSLLAESRCGTNGWLSQRKRLRKRHGIDSSHWIAVSLSCVAVREEREGSHQSTLKGDVRDQDSPSLSSRDFEIFVISSTSGGIGRSVRTYLRKVSCVSFHRPPQLNTSATQPISVISSSKTLGPVASTSCEAVCSGGKETLPSVRNLYAKSKNPS